MTVRPLTPEDEKACVAIVSSLPEWFGYPGALDDVARAVRTQPGFALIEREVVAFLTTSHSFEEALEITYLAVHRDHRRAGHGAALVKAAARHAEVEGYRSLCLLTLGPSSASPHYAETVAFYQALGFWRMKELYLTAWGGAPTLVMCAPLATLADRPLLRPEEKP